MMHLTYLCYFYIINYVGGTHTLESFLPFKILSDLHFEGYTFLFIINFKLLNELA